MWLKIALPELRQDSNRFVRAVFHDAAEVSKSAHAQSERVPERLAFGLGQQEFFLLKES